jgi:hypothetical protein
VSDLDELRHDLAVDHGLDPAVVEKLVVGSTVAEIEASVDKLAALIGSSKDFAHEREHAREREHDRDPLSAALARAPIEKARAQQALVASLHGGSSQARDEQGRYARGSFDGGARASAPAPVDASAEHDALVARLAVRESVHRGGGF